MDITDGGRVQTLRGNGAYLARWDITAVVGLTLAAGAANNARGGIAGIVVNTVTKAYLDGALVIREQTGGQEVTNKEGRFRFDTVRVGPPQVFTSSLGLKTKRLSGFTSDEAQPITSDEFRQSVAWKNSATSTLLAGTSMLRVHLENAELFVVTFN